MRPATPVPIMIGRDPELATARQLLDAAGRGAGGVLLVTGEAGIGKTRLLDELVASPMAAAAGPAADTTRPGADGRAPTADAPPGAPGGPVVLTGRAIPGGGTYRALSSAVGGLLRTTPADRAGDLRPFRAALSRLAPGWAGSETNQDPAGEGGPDPTVLLGEGLLRLLAGAGRDRGCLLVLEDLHWADPDTLALVGYLAGAIRSSPVLLAVSARDDQAATAGDPAGGVTIDDLAMMPEVNTLRLGRLDDRAVADIATSVAGDQAIPDEVLAELVAKADGLPVVIDELLSALRDPARPATAVPPTFAGLVRRRVGLLADHERSVLHAAAVLGDDPDWRLLPAITGEAEPAVTNALRAIADTGLLITESRRLRWRHGLTRDVVLAAMLPPERARFARAAADAVAATGDPQSVALQAELLVLAGEHEMAGAVLLRLARRDMARGALRSAAEHLDRAAATGGDAGRLAIDRVALLTLTGKQQAALDVGTAALHRLTGDDHAELCLRMARAAVAGGRWEEVGRLVERAGRPADPRSSTLLAEAAFGAGDPGTAQRLAASAVDLATAGDDVETACAASMVIGRCAELADPQAAIAAFRRVAQQAGEHGLLLWQVEAMFGLGRMELLNQGSPAGLKRAREMALDVGLLAVALSIESIMAEFAFVVDGPRAAEPMAAKTAELAAQLRLTGLQAMAELLRATGRVDAGDVPGMLAQVAAAQALPHISAEIGAIAAAVRSLPALLGHDLPRADEQLDAGFRPLVQHASAAPIAYWGMWALLRTCIADDPWPREFLRSAPPGRRDTNRGAVGFADAVVAGRAGDRELAARLFAEADRMLTVPQWWRRLLRLVTLEAAVLDGWGDPVPELRADLAVFERDGEDQLARTCRDLLRRAGAPTRRGRGTAQVPPELRALGVTSREADVLALIHQGLPNAEIAKRLFLSPRTVETHVANLLAKTGAADRGSLRALGRTSGAARG